MHILQILKHIELAALQFLFEPYLHTQKNLFDMLCTSIGNESVDKGHFHFLK